MSVKTGRFLSVLSFIYILFLSSSCAFVKHKELVAFQGVRNQPLEPKKAVEEVIISSLQSDSISNLTEIRIEPEDQLHITVSSFDPEAVKAFNMMNEGANAIATAQPQNLELLIGYFVDYEGNIDFPIIGKVKLAGLTLEESKTKLVTLLEKYVKGGVVNIRFINFKFTILGEVKKPGVIKSITKRITLLEAIGLAGDLTDYANKSTILVIREKDKIRTYTRLSLQQKDLFLSPCFYLKQNDIIYIEPIKAKKGAVADETTRIITIASTGLTILTLLITLLKK
jgi:polysaccharide biosynthesis/export protein